MDKWLIIYGIVFFAGLLVTAGATPLFRRLAHVTGMLDRPSSNHKGHAQATALFGGAAMFSSWLLIITGASAVVYFNWIPECFSNIYAMHLPGFSQVAQKELFFIALGALFAVLLGLIDDKWALKAKWKFLGQFAVALTAVIWGGVRINVFINSEVFSICITIFWIMLLMNAINFFDNMDGLAVGTIAVAMLFFTIISALNNEYFVAAFAALNCGVCCGFWIYNSNPASIFMGDSGSHFLGYLAAVVSAGTTYFDLRFSQSRFPVLIPLLILALPLFDTFMVVVIRTLNKKPFWIGDHNHISHRFVRMGLSRKMAVMLVHLMALNIALGALPVYWGDFRTAAIILLQTVVLFSIITILQFFLEVRKDAVEEHKKITVSDKK
ncbi:MAG: undecaprenyl/decaprenyl-phosphate alpha-N-acetylglucosaminyl 1-phosphate transferase [Lentisphaerae bacterium]|nr:undecaprenyl/decaprenyl-phosphate alpha-N-acetylglucosaminyl 1-phosphate transferase [Lentisphaerota bacterium]